MIELIKLRKKLGKLLFNFSEQTLPDGTVIVTDGDQPVEGGNINTYDANGAVIPLPDGSYTLESGDVVDVVGGIVTKITPVEPVVETPMADIIPSGDTTNPTETPESPEPQDTEVLSMVQDLLEKVMELDARCSAMEASMGGMSTQVEKMSQHIPVDEIKQEVTFTKMEKSEIASTNASRILGSK